jgi:hypothetical protein
VEEEEEEEEEEGVAEVVWGRGFGAGLELFKLGMELLGIES